MKGLLDRRFAVAPMIDWSDRHCRFFHRQLSARALLYTEMVVADAIIYGDAERLLGFDPSEHPVALQIGGSDPAKLAKACSIAASYGYDEINLNVGCPSDRVQSGAFGACLMRDPGLVGECLAAMVDASAVPVTVKCRLGVDDQDIEPALDALADASVEAGVDAIWVHARKAWLDGLSPKQNRDVPPLDYARVYRLKTRLPNLFVGLNGGLRDLDTAAAQTAHVDGVMLGRAAYQTPGVLRDVDRRFFGETRPTPAYPAVIEAMAAYADNHLERGGRLSQVTRHMVGLFAGKPGARRWRQMLSEGAASRGADAQLIRRAFAEIRLCDDAAASSTQAFGSVAA